MIGDLETVAATRVGDVVRSTGGGRIVGTLPSVTNWVFLVERPSGDRAVAKYGMLGHSCGTVETIVRSDGIDAVLERQRAYELGPTRLRSEHDVLSTLASVAAGRFSSPLTYQDGVLLLDYVEGEPLLDRLARLDGEALLDDLRASLRAIDEVHEIGRDPVVRQAVSGTDVESLRSDIRGTFVRKFRAGTPHAAVATANGWDDALLAGLASRLEVEAAATAAAGTATLVVGDAKPDHVVFVHGGGVVFIDASPHRAHPCVDEARFFSRTAIAMRSRPTAPDDARTLARLVEDRLSTSRSSPGALACLIVADVMNIVTTYVAMDRPSLRRQPPGVQRVERDAGPLVEVCAGAARVLAGDLAAPSSTVHRLLTGLVS